MLSWRAPQVHRQVDAVATSACSFAPPLQLHSYCFLLLCVSELQQVTWLALHCLADGLERGESDSARLSGFQNRQVGERDSDSLGQLRERHSTLVKHLVHLDDDRHGQTVPSRSSRMRAPCSKTRANTKSSSTVSQDRKSVV